MIYVFLLLFPLFNLTMGISFEDTMLALKENNPEIRIIELEKDINLFNFLKNVNPVKVTLSKKKNFTFSNKEKVSKTYDTKMSFSGKLSSNYLFNCLSSNLEYKIRKSNILQKRRKIILEAVKSYMDLYNIMEEKNLIQRRYEKNEKSLHESMIKHKFGRIPFSDLEICEANLLLLKNEIFDLDNKLKIAKKKFTICFGYIPSSNLSLPQIDVVLERDFTEFKEKVKKNNSTLLRLGCDENASNISLLNNLISPVEVSLNSDISNNLTKGNRNKVNTLSVTLSLSEKNVFDMLNSIKKKRITFIQNKIEKDKLFIDLESLWNSFISENKSSNYLDKCIAAYSKLVSSCEIQYSLGKIDLFKLFDAREKLYEKKKKLISSVTLKWEKYFTLLERKNELDFNTFEKKVKKTS